MNCDLTQFTDLLQFTAQRETERGNGWGRGERRVGQPVPFGKMWRKGAGWMDRVGLAAAIEKVLEEHRVTVAGDGRVQTWVCTCGARTTVGSLEGIRKMNRMHLATVLADRLVGGADESGAGAAGQ